VTHEVNIDWKDTRGFSFTCTVTFYDDDSPSGADVEDLEITVYDQKTGKSVEVDLGVVEAVQDYWSQEIRDAAVDTARSLGSEQEQDEQED
jgi:hypothetical protein